MAHLNCDFRVAKPLVTVAKLRADHLVSAALDALLGGERSVLVPAAIASAVLFAFNVAMLWHAFDFDRRSRSTVDP